MPSFAITIIIKKLVVLYYGATVLFKQNFDVTYLINLTKFLNEKVYTIKAIYY